MSLYISGRTEIEDGKQKQAWERARWTALALLQPHISKGKKLKLTDLAVFPWEEQIEQKKEVDPRTREKWEKWDEEMKKAYGKQA